MAAPVRAKPPSIRKISNKQIKVNKSRKLISTYYVVTNKSKLA